MGTWFTNEPKQTDIDYKALSRLINDKTALIHFETLEKLCAALKCTPNKLFDIKPMEINHESQLIGKVIFLSFFYF